MHSACISVTDNDRAHVSVQWLVQQVMKRGLVVRHLLRIRHTSSGSVHYLAVLPDGRYICNCCMPLNLGIPCRHYFRAWIDVQGLPFHISLIRPRWYQDPGFATESIPAVSRTHELQPGEFKFETSLIRTVFASNPIDTTSHAGTPPLRTQTLPARADVQAAIRPLMAGVQTTEQVKDLVKSLQGFQ
ncbi:hypothetical protein GGX14DRAFT_366085 [Mycena pura]|uniref:SWIM-type domain-containing protein n=1 Tax=Mycena pura TaxID=153505 RepID=A0AAD6VA96_9AGAR|nr:hypothetical protein GGX14DRAFT_366085 [Mycena pura]